MKKRVEEGDGRIEKASSASHQVEITSDVKNVAEGQEEEESGKEEVKESAAQVLAGSLDPSNEIEKPTTIQKRESQQDEASSPPPQNQSYTSFAPKARISRLSKFRSLFQWKRQPSTLGGKKKSD